MVTKSPRASDIPSALRVLKQMFRARGMSYADVAAAMGKSESSLKRYLAGQRLTLHDLEQMCGILGISLGEFYELAGREIGTKPDALTESQEAALGEDPALVMVLVLLMHGRTAAEAAQELGLPTTDLFALLMQLERLGLAKVYPGDRVRTLVGPSLQVRRGGPIRQGADQVLRRAFAEMDFSRDDAPWAIEMVKLSPASVEQLRAMSLAFGMQLRALAERDHKKGGDGQWYFHLSAALAVDLPAYLHEVRRPSSFCSMNPQEHQP